MLISNFSHPTNYTFQNCIDAVNFVLCLFEDMTHKFVFCATLGTTELVSDIDQ